MRSAWSNRALRMKARYLPMVNWKELRQRTEVHRSVPVLIRFVRTVLRYTDIGGLGVRELSHLSAKPRELQARHFLVQVFW